ncbi:hypothetical protein JW905_16800 [bacterium]|nr:hypothetical protein [candidate division CSSED10-310 bacterium]
MKCREFRRRMRHGTSLTDTYRADMEEHLRTCDHCAARFASTWRLQELIDEARNVDMPELDENAYWRKIESFLPPVPTMGGLTPGAAGEGLKVSPLASLTAMRNLLLPDPVLGLSAAILLLLIIVATRPFISEARFTSVFENLPEGENARLELLYSPDFLLKSRQLPTDLPATTFFWIERK